MMENGKNVKHEKETEVWTWGNHVISLNFVFEIKEFYMIVHRIVFFIYYLLIHYLFLLWSP